jgi:hypothetical protein
MFTDFEAVVYENSVGKYEVHIKLKDVSNYEWNFSKLRKKYPEQVERLQSFGFTNKSRDLYAKGMGIKHAMKSRVQADFVCKMYNLILSQKV